MGSLLLAASGGGCLVNYRAKSWRLPDNMSRIQRASQNLARRSPLLLSSCKKKERPERHKMLRLSMKKLRKIRDSECLLHKTVLISNTMESLRKGDDEMESASNNYDTSHYSPEEEEILNSIRLPTPITPISDAQDNTEDNMDTTESNPTEYQLGRLESPLPSAIGRYGEISTYQETDHLKLRSLAQPHYQAVISHTDHDKLQTTEKLSTTVVEHFYKNLHSLQYIIAG